MNPMLRMIAQQFMTGQMRNNPMLAQVSQLLNGKTPQQQFETLINCAKSKGFDVNAKMFTDADLQSLGITPPAGVNSPQG